MSFLRLSTFSLLALLIVSCNNNIGDFTLSDFRDDLLSPVNSSISLEELSLDPARMIYHPAGFLIIAGNSEKPLLSILDLSSGKIQKIINKGRGPGELLGIWLINLAGEELVLHGLDERKILHLALGKDRLFFIKKELIVPEYYGRISPFKNGYVGLPMQKEGTIMCVLDSTAKVISTIPYPDYYSRNGIPGNNSVYQCNINCDSGKDRIIVSYKSIPFIDTYNSSGSLIAHRQGPELFEWSLSRKEIGGGAHIYLQQPSIRTYNRGIILPDHSWMTQYYPVGEKGTTYLLWFDPSGKPLKKYLLPEQAGLYSVDWTSRRLYLVVSEHERPSLKVYSF